MLRWLRREWRWWKWMWSWPERGVLSEPEHKAAIHKWFQLRPDKGEWPMDLQTLREMVRGGSGITGANALAVTEIRSVGGSDEDVAIDIQIAQAQIASNAYNIAQALASRNLSDADYEAADGPAARGLMQIQGPTMIDDGTGVMVAARTANDWNDALKLAWAGIDQSKAAAGL